VSHFINQRRTKSMSLTWKPRTNTTSRRRSRWCRSSTTRRSFATVNSIFWKAVLRAHMHRCVQQALAQPPLGRGPDRLYCDVYRQAGGPHGHRQRRRLSGCSGHRIRRLRYHVVQLIVHLKPNLPSKSLLISHEFLCARTTTVADVV
jgi:hypothetical protein